MLAREVHRAGGNKKMFVNQMDHAIGEARREVRAEINRAVLDQAARDVDARILFKRGVADVGISLVVAKQDIEFRLVLLDEIVFEGQRFFLIVDDDVIQIGDFADERAGLGVLRLDSRKYERTRLRSESALPT